MNVKAFFQIFLLVAVIWLILSTYIKKPLDSLGPYSKVPINSRGQNISIEDLEAYVKTNKFPNGIPKVVHYVYTSRMVPSQYVPLVSVCAQINPIVRFVFWSDWSSLELIRSRYPKYLEVYRSYLGKGADPLKKSDIIRYFLLRHFGGVYMDLDTKCQKPLEVAMDRHSCILSRETEVQSRIRWNFEFMAMNSFMACVSEHRFFDFLINELRKDDNSWILPLTGPIFLTVRYTKYVAGLTASTSADPLQQVILASSDTFSPFSETFLERFCNNPSGKWKVKGCQDLPAYRKVEKNISANAIVNHLFFHLGYDFAKHLIKKNINIGTVRSVLLVV